MVVPEPGDQGMSPLVPVINKIVSVIRGDTSGCLPVESSCNGVTTSLPPQYGSASEHVALSDLFPGQSKNITY